MNILYSLICYKIQSISKWISDIGIKMKEKKKKKLLTTHIESSINFASDDIFIGNGIEVIPSGLQSGRKVPVKIHRTNGFASFYSSSCFFDRIVIVLQWTKKKNTFSRYDWIGNIPNVRVIVRIFPFFSISFNVRNSSF